MDVSPAVLLTAQLNVVSVTSKAVSQMLLNSGTKVSVVVFTLYQRAHRQEGKEYLEWPDDRGM